MRLTTSKGAAADSRGTTRTTPTLVSVAHQRSGRRSGRRLAARLKQFAVDLVSYVDTPFRSV